MVDVYSSVFLPFMFFLLVVSKFVFFVVSYRLFLIFNAYVLSLSLVVWAFSLVCALTYIMGLIGAFYQTNLRKIVVYSSISNNAFLLSCFIINSTFNTALFLFLAFFYFLSLSLFIFLLFFLSNHPAGISPEIHDKEISSLAGVFYKHKGLTIVLFSTIVLIAAFPPAITFFPKILVILGFVNSPALIFKSLAILFILGSALAMFYYSRLIRILFVKDQSATYSTPPVSFIARMTFISV